jgi:uncharacterized protein YceK
MKYLIPVLLLVAVLLSACGSPVQAVDPSQIPADEKYYCVRPESDNGNSWHPNAVVCYDTQVYTVVATVLGDLSSNQTVSGEFTSHGYGNGYSSGYGRMWTDGKGVLPVQINSINPPADWLRTDLPYIVKTTDLGVMGVPAGAQITLICNHDVEVLSPVFPNQTLSTDRLTDELDNCRLDTKNYIPAPIQ